MRLKTDNCWFPEFFIPPSQIPLKCWKTMWVEVTFQRQYKTRKVGFNGKNDSKIEREPSGMKASRIRKSMNPVEKFRRWCLLVIGTGLGLIQKWRTPFPRSKSYWPSDCSQYLDEEARSLAAKQLCLASPGYPNPAQQKAGKPRRVINRGGVRSSSRREQGSAFWRAELVSYQEISSLQGRESLPLLFKRFHH